MKGYAMLEIGKKGWIEKDRPVCGPRDAIIRPLAVSPCSSSRCYKSRRSLYAIRHGTNRFPRCRIS